VVGEVIRLMVCRLLLVGDGGPRNARLGYVGGSSSMSIVNMWACSVCECNLTKVRGMLAYQVRM